jgi:hypothetical protein
VPHPTDRLAAFKYLMGGIGLLSIWLFGASAMDRMMRRVWTAAWAALCGWLLVTHPGSAQQPAKVKVPDTVVFEPNIEYANPDGQRGSQRPSCARALRSGALEI